MRLANAKVAVVCVMHSDLQIVDPKILKKGEKKVLWAQFAWTGQQAVLSLQASEFVRGRTRDKKADFLCDL
jgi:hypothetical protein